MLLYSQTFELQHSHTFNLQPRLFMFVPLVLIIIAIISAINSTQRRKMLSAFAAQMGWVYDSGDPFGIPAIYSCFECLTRGDSEAAYNTMFGRYVDLDFRAFDYRYSTGSGKNRQVHYLSAVVVQAKYPLKGLLIRPEGFGDRLAGMVGFEDIDFESDEFNRAFYVKCEDKQFAYDVISQRMMETLMEYKGWSIQVFCDELIVYNGSTFSTEDYTTALSLAGRFLQLLPDYLEDKLRSQ